MAFQFPPALRQRRFALLWGGQLISIAGSQMQAAALLWHLRTLSDQPILVSGIGLVRFLPILFFAPIGGVVADHYNRRKVLFITETTMAITALMLGLLTWLNAIQVWHIYLLTGIQAVAISFDLPSRQALIPNLLPRNMLPSAFSLNSIAQNTGSILGPALSGVVIGFLGQQWAYWINAISFGAVLLALIMMGAIYQETKAGGMTINGSLLSIREGVHFILHQRIILSSMVLDFVATFFSSAYTLLPFVARDLLHVNEVAYGWLVSADSLGAVLVGLFMSQRINIRRQGALLMGAVVSYGLATILLGLSFTYFMALISLMLVGASDSVSTILRNTIRQLQTPDYIRGRMVSINQIFFQGGPQLGEIESGAVAQAFGPQIAIVTGGIGCIVGVVLVAILWPQLRKYNGDEPVLTE